MLANTVKHLSSFLLASPEPKIPVKVAAHKFGDKQTFTKFKVTMKKGPERRVCSNT